MMMDKIGIKTMVWREVEVLEIFSMWNQQNLVMIRHRQ